MNSIFKLALSYSAIEGLQKGISFFVVPFLTYYITPEEYGNVAIVLMIVSFFLIFFTFSLDATLMRYYVRIKNEKFRREFLGTIYLGSWYFALVWMILVFMVGPKVFHYFLPGLSVVPYMILAILIAMFKLINLFYITYVKSIQDIKEYAKFYNVYFFLQTALILVFVLIPLFTKKDIMYMLGLLLSQIVTVYYIHLKIKSVAHLKLNKRILFIALNYSFSVIPIKLVNILNSSVDRYLLLYFINSTIVGVYYLGLQLASAVQMLMLSINSAYLPKFYQLYEKNKNDKNFFQIYKIIDIIILFAGIIEVSALHVYPIVFYFIDSSYESAKQIVPLLIFYFSLSIVYFINANILSLSAMLNRKKAHGIIVGIMLNIVISLILIKRYDMIGVAVGTIVGFIVSIVYFIFLVKNYTEFKIKSFQYLLYLFILFIINYYIVSVLMSVFLSAIIVVIFIFLNKLGASKLMIKQKF